MTLEAFRGYAKNGGAKEKIAKKFKRQAAGIRLALNIGKQG